MAVMPTSAILASKVKSFLPAANIASKVLGSVFGGSKGPSFRQQLNNARTAQHKNIMGQFASTMKAAKVNKIHPLVALGIQPSSGGVVGNFQNDMPGQNISRAIGATVSGFKEKQMEDLAIERANLENDLLRAQISDINSSPSDAKVTVPMPFGNNQEGAVEISGDRKAGPLGS